MQSKLSPHTPTHTIGRLFLSIRSDRSILPLSLAVALAGIGLPRETPLLRSLPHQELPALVVQLAQVLDLPNDLQVIGQLHKLPIRGPVLVRLLEGSDLEPIAGVHHEIAPEVVKHNGVLARVLALEPRVLPNHPKGLAINRSILSQRNRGGREQTKEMVSQRLSVWYKLGRRRGFG